MTIKRTTKGITVSVDSAYLPEQSRPRLSQFIHGYQIKIENHSKQTVQLLRRHWYIKNEIGEIREVEGEGVIGQCPILKPTASHAYTSYCPLDTEMGAMWGYYTMEDKQTGEEFEVEVPEFQLIAPLKLN